MARKALSLLFLLVGLGLVVAITGPKFDLIGILADIGSTRSMLMVSGLALALSGVIQALPLRRRALGEWLLLGVAVLAVALAADVVSDLLILSGVHALEERPSLRQTLSARVLMLALVGFALVASRYAPDATEDRPYIREWTTLLALCRQNAARFLVVSAQLGLLVVVIHQYHLLNRVFYHTILLFIFCGFLLHNLLPLRYRLPFFLMLSLVCILAVFGLTTGAWLIGLGLILIGICHLPIPYAARCALLLVVGALLAVLRTDRIHAPWSGAIWPILGSMFMFRLIVYMYDLKHYKEPRSVSRTLSYFFLLPNIVFPLFPVVDYSTFRRTYYDDDKYRIYQLGLDWIVRGAFHLILYRYVNYYLMIATRDVVNVTDLCRYLLANFGLYLRVSGQFHLIVGILRLFGFGLPETHHLYFLASSFTDFWRRINIYWKDFMQKLFYYPAYFRVRKLGTKPGLVLATLYVFFLTWFFHGYQWFWLRGSFLISMPDILFWGILAVLVIINSLWETQHGRQRTLGKRALTAGEIATTAVRTLATFTVLCILWSLWSSPSLVEWFALWSFAGVHPALAVLIPVVLAALIIYGGTARRRVTGGVGVASPDPAPPGFLRATVGSVALMLALLAFSSQRFTMHLPEKAQKVVFDMRQDRLSEQDNALLTQGYYEDLLGVDRFNSQLWEVYMKRPHEWAGMAMAFAQPTHDFMGFDLRPSVAGDYRGASFHTNRWGLRDKDYEKHKPARTYRIVLLGSSHEMGSGVGDNETFESLLEARLNKENDGSKYARYEILNFAMDGFISLQELMMLEKRALDFQPDAVFYAAHKLEASRAVDHLASKVRDRVAIPSEYDYLQQIVNKTGLNASTPPGIAARMLTPYSDDITLWTYTRIVTQCRQRGILPVWIYVPPVDNIPYLEEAAHLADLAKKAGFVIVNLSGVYDNQQREALYVAEWDKHPNAQGHRLLAERLYNALKTQANEIPIGMNFAEPTKKTALSQPTR
ncbi:MAG TPA: hypothetical protein VFB21_12835 [Chthonomonadaceae bacterium]|nr:hypothetical protein [Chthonomonadaceae bacterium]